MAKRTKTSAPETLLEAVQAAVPYLYTDVARLIVEFARSRRLLVMRDDGVLWVDLDHPTDPFHTERELQLNDKLRCGSWDPTGQRVALVNEHGRLRLWDPWADRLLSHDFGSFNLLIEDARLLPEGHLVVVHQDGSDVYVTSQQGGGAQRATRRLCGYRHPTLSSDGGQCVALMRSGPPQFCFVDTRTLVVEHSVAFMSTHLGAAVTQLTLHHGPLRRVAVGTAAGEVVVLTWPVSEVAEVAWARRHVYTHEGALVRHHVHCGEIVYLQFDGPGQRLLSLSRDSQVVLWYQSGDLDWQPRWTCALSTNVRCADFSGDGQRVVVMTYSALFLLDAQSGAVLRTRRMATSTLCSAEFAD